MAGRRWLRQLMARFGRDQRGNAAMVFGLAALPLVAGAGLAIDTLLAYSVEDQLQKSLDAAGLAAMSGQVAGMSAADYTRRLARLHRDGRVDGGFPARPNGIVNSLALQQRLLGEQAAPLRLEHVALDVILACGRAAGCARTPASGSCDAEEIPAQRALVAHATAALHTREERALEQIVHLVGAPHLVHEEAVDRHEVPPHELVARLGIGAAPGSEELCVGGHRGHGGRALGASSIGESGARWQPRQPSRRAPLEPSTTPPTACAALAPRSAPAAGTSPAPPRPRRPAPSPTLRHRARAPPSPCSGSAS